MNGVIASWALTLAIGVSGASGDWHEDYSHALSVSQISDKPLLVVLHNPDDSQQTNRQIGLTADLKQASLLKNYDLCEIDVSTPNGQRIAKAFKARSFPYTVITNKTAEKIVYRKAGTFTDGEWITMLVDYRRGMRPFTISTVSSRKTSFDNCST